jgi:hypothetical protein
MGQLITETTKLVRALTKLINIIITEYEDDE